MTIYRLVITAELERLDPHGATDWRGSHNIATVADIDSLAALVQGDEIAVAVRNLAYRIVSEEIQKMAVAGGMTSAYRCNVSDNALIAAPTTYPSKDCANVEAALAILARGETCIVAAADMSALRARLLAEKVG